jgi:hypothetical protein
MSFQDQLKKTSEEKRTAATKVRQEANALLQAAEAAEAEAAGTEAAYQAYIASTGSKTIAPPVAKKTGKPKTPPAAVAAPPTGKRRGRPPKDRSQEPAKVETKKDSTKVKAAPVKKAAAKEAVAKAPKAPKAAVEGKLPPLRERIRLVLGDGALEVKAIILGLEKRNWLPQSNDPPAYISVMLASSKDHFVRVQRGVYKAIQTGEATVQLQADKPAKVKVSPRNTNGKATKSVTESDNGIPSKSVIEAEVAELGSNVAENPFLS